MKLEFSPQFFEEYSNIKFHENTSCGSRVVPCGQTDMKVLIVVFINFSEPKNWSHWGYSSRELWPQRGRNASSRWAVDQRTSEVVGKIQ
jgi:hypothetical protein